MASPSSLIFAAIDAPTAMVIAAILTFFGVLAQQVFRKTPKEAAIDQATARLTDAQASGEMLKQARDLAAMWQAQAETARRELAEARAEVEDLRDEIDQLRRELGELRDSTA